MKCIRRFASITIAFGVVSIFGISNLYAQTVAISVEDKAELWSSLDDTKEIVTTIDKEENLEVIGAEGDYYLVSLNDEYDEIEGYILKDTVHIQSTDGISTGDRVNIRQNPNTSCKVLGQVNRNDSLMVIGKSGNWYKINYNDEEAWIFGDYVKITDEEVLFEKEVEGYSNNDSNEIIDYAKQFIGTPYRYGGTDLTGGVDCSGFTQGVMGHFGISLSRSSRTQVSDGYAVSKNDLQPGDLVFFDTSGVNNGGISHVGIYVGDNRIIHAECTRGVTISSLSESYYTRTYVKAVRVL